VPFAGEGHADPTVSAVPRLRPDQHRLGDAQPVPTRARRPETGAVRTNRDRVVLYMGEVPRTQGKSRGRQLPRLLRHHL